VKARRSQAGKGQALIGEILMKRIVLFVLMLIPLWLAAQDMPFTVRAKTRFASSGMIGYETIDSLTFYRARLI
jgi:hypothetical protein